MSPLNWHRLNRILFCGEPIKRLEYFKRVGLVYVPIIIAGFFFLITTAETLSEGSESAVISVLIASALLVVGAVLQLFWVYWRIRDCFDGRNKAALAFLISLVLQLFWVWFLWPSQKTAAEVDG